MKNTELTRYAYIDALRGLAILGVVVVHSSHWVTPASSLVSAFAAQGARGVQLFFLASALTLFLSMATRTGREAYPATGFFIRRFFRIAPLFYLAIIVFTLYDGLSGRYWAPNGLEWWYIPLTALFINGWHPETITSVVPGGWSIAVEMTFYVTMPFLFLRLTGIRSTLTALVLSLLLSKALTGMVIGVFQPVYPDSQQYLVGSFGFVWFFSQLPVFVLGILLYHIIRKYPEPDARMSVLSLLTALAVFAALARIGAPTSLLPEHVLFGIGFLFLALSLHLSPNWLLVNSTTILLGKLSFSIYLVHFLVLKIMNAVFSEGFILDGNSGFVAAFLLVLTCSTGISYVTYNLVELPGINLGRKIIRKL